MANQLTPAVGGLAAKVRCKVVLNLIQRIERLFIKDADEWNRVFDKEQEEANATVMRLSGLPFREAEAELGIDKETVNVRRSGQPRSRYYRERSERDVSRTKEAAERVLSQVDSDQ